MPPELPSLALLVDALNPRAVRSQHPPRLAAALRAAGARAEVFPVTAGLVPRVPQAHRAPDAPPPELDERGPSLAAYRPDVLVAYDPDSPAAWLAARFARRRSLPLLLVDPAWFPLRRWHERLREGVGRRLWGAAVRAEAARVLVTDPVARERALERGFDPDRIEVLPGGVDLVAFRPGRTTSLVGRHRLRGRLLLNVGPLEPGRGLETLLTAFAGSVGQRDDWSLVFAGDGTLRRRLRIVADRLGVGSRVHLIGFPDPEELPGLLAASTLLAVPAEDERVRGRQVRAALACGLPVLVSAQRRIAHLVEHERTGLVVDTTGVPDWTAALRRACGAPQARARWAREARAYAERELDWERPAARVLAIAREARAERAEAPAEGGGDPIGREAV